MRIQLQPKIAKLYVATFNRAADSAGLDYWLNDSGLSLEQIASSFFNQTETLLIYEDLDNESFVQAVYANLFNRSAEQAGVDYWVDELNSGNVEKSVFILAVINGAQDSDSSQDATILENKTTVAIAFSDAGLNDAENAISVLENISADSDSVSSALEQIDSWSASDSSSSSNGLLAYTPISNSFDGLTLIAPMGSKTTYLIDDYGQALHQWSSEFSPGLSAYLLSDGSLLKTGSDNSGYFNEGGKGGYIEEMDWNGNITWQYKYSDESKSLHHDIELLPNGNILALSWEVKGDIWTEVIIEIEKLSDNEGYIVWSWDIWDHLDELGLDSSSAKTEDWIHLNSIDYNLASNQIMVSSRSHNQVWIINKDDSSIATISSIDMYGQHDAKWIDDMDANSNITIFDNGQNYSRSLEVDPSLSNIIWSYGNADSEFFYGSHISGTLRLDNGNTIVCNGVDGVIFELDSSDNKLWEYTNSYGSTTPKGTITSIFRAEKYASSYTPYF